jgi:hypothetical protein
VDHERGYDRVANNQAGRRLIVRIDYKAINPINPRDRFFPINQSEKLEID